MVRSGRVGRAAVDYVRAAAVAADLVELDSLRDAQGHEGGVAPFQPHLDLFPERGHVLLLRPPKTQTMARNAKPALKPRPRSGRSAGGHDQNKGNALIHQELIPIDNDKQE